MDKRTRGVVPDPHDAGLEVVLFLQQLLRQSVALVRGLGLGLGALEAAEVLPPDPSDVSAPGTTTALVVVEDAQEVIRSADGDADG